MSESESVHDSGSSSSSSSSLDSAYGGSPQKAFDSSSPSSSHSDVSDVSGGGGASATSDDGDVLWLASFIVRHPYIQVGVVTLMVIAIAVLLMITGWFELAAPHSHDYMITGNIDVSTYDSMISGMEFVLEANSPIQEPQSVIQPFLTVQLLYEVNNEGDTLFTRSNLKAMRKMEKKLVDDDDFPFHCWIRNGTCQYSSIVDLFVDPVTDDIVDDVAARVDYIATELYDDVSFLLSRDFGKKNKKAAVARSMFMIGRPLYKNKARTKQFDNEFDDEDEQYRLYEEWVVGFRDYYLNDAPTDDVSVIFFSPAIYDLEFFETSFNDFVYAVGSVVFVFLYMAIHTTSPFLAAGGMIMILFSFPLSYFVYRGILQVTFFQTLHILSVFIILGIGADDVFVFQDAWVQSGFGGFAVSRDLEKRMSWVFRRAAKAILATSLTTAIAFLATATSRIMPISAFGVFCSILVVMNYLLVMTFYPAVVVIWYTHVVGSCAWCNPMWDACGCTNHRLTATDSDDSNDTHSHSHYSDSSSAEKGVKYAPSPGGRKARGKVAPTSSGDAVRDFSASDSDNDSSDDVSGSFSRDPHDLEEFRRVERFFYETYVPFIHSYRYIILGFFLVLFVLVAFGSSFMKPAPTIETLFPKKHVMARAADILDNEITPGETDGAVYVHLYWGMELNDVSDVNKWDPGDRGKLIWDKSFDIVPEKSQEFLLDTCEAARNMPARYFDKTKQTYCWIEEFKSWREARNESFPVPTEAELLYGLSVFFDYTQSDPRYASDYGLDVGLVIDSGNIKYTRISIPTPLHGFEETVLVLEQRDEWEKFINKRNDKAESMGVKGMTGGRQTGGFYWMWMRSSQEFTRSAVKGALFSLLFAFFMLTFSTFNWIIGMFATVTVMGVVGTVVSVMVLMGWDLGIVESIAMIIIIGFSIDYVVHYANSYVESESKDRYNRTRDAVTQMGVSVVAGATTTLGSSLFLWGCVITFFTKFAILIMTTILTSLLWSTVFFLTLCITFGPNGNTGSIFNLLERCGVTCARRGSASSSASGSASESVESDEEPSSSFA